MAYPTHGNEFHERIGWAAPCRVATTANITIATALNAGDTIDGVTLAAGDRVLVKDQTAPAQNGIYVAGASPARAVDFADEGNIVGAVVFVVEGTAHGLTAWAVQVPAPLVVGTDDITFAAFGVGAGGAHATSHEDGGSDELPVESLPTAETDTTLVLAPNGTGGVEFRTEAGGSSDPHITGTGTGFINFPAGTESIRALMPGNVAGLQLEESGYAMLFAGIFVNAYAYISEVLSYLSNNVGEVRLEAPSISITGADAAGGSNDDGIDVHINGGAGDGSGRQGLVILDSLPTSDPGVSGALWNDSGTIKISP